MAVVTLATILGETLTVLVLCLLWCVATPAILNTTGKRHAKKHRSKQDGSSESSDTTTPPVQPASPPTSREQQVPAEQQLVVPPPGQFTPSQPVLPLEPPAGAPFFEPPKRKMTGIIIGVCALVVCIVVAVVLVVVLPGSSDKGKANTLINKAASLLTDSVTKHNTLKTDLNNVKDMTNFPQYENKLLAEVKDMDSDLNNAQKYISQVSSLNGVKPYKDLAVVLTAVIRTNLTQSRQITQCLDYMGAQVKSANAGQPIDYAAFSAKLSDFNMRLRELDAKVSTLRKKAEKLYDNLKVEE